MRIVKYAESLDEIKKDFFDGTIHGAFFIQHDLEKEIKEGKNTTVVVYKNTSNLIIGNTILKDASAVLRTVSAGVQLKKLRAKGMNYEKALNIANPIRIETHSLFNPNYSYQKYLAPGLIAFTFQLLIMTASVIVISSEFSHGTFRELMKLSKNTPFMIFIGKAVPHFAIHTATAFMIIGLVFPFFNIKICGSILLLIFFLMVFIAACFNLGLFISSIVHDQLFATEISVFINTPAFILSGFTFPLSAMPIAHNALAQLLPFTHFLNGLLKIYQMKGTFMDVWNETVILGLFALVSAVLTLLALRYQINLYSKAEEVV
jgi:ABC-2 type transport system permease protein